MADTALTDKWEEVLSILKGIIPEASYNTFILPLVPHCYENSNLVLLTPYSFSIQTIKLSYEKDLLNALAKVYNEQITYQIIYSAELEKQIEKENKKLQKAEKSEKNLDTKYDNLKQMTSDCKLNLKYTFERFVVGAYNKLAYGAALSVAQGKSDNKYNPLFIYGGSGLGKTHLMQAIGHYVLTKRNGKKIKYFTSEEFLNDLMSALHKGIDKDIFTTGNEKNKLMTKFREKYTSPDILLIDDIQFVAGKERTQNEVFKMFDILHQAGKQIVFTSDKPPSDIPNLSDRLKTRFEWGLTVDIGIPDLETRMAILKQLSDAEDEEYRLSLETIQFLASIYKNNIRELEGAFNRVKAYCQFLNLKPDMATVKLAIKYDEKLSTITMGVILDKISEFYNLPVSEIIGSSRQKNYAKARQIFIYLSREIIGESYESIGSFLSGRKHTTIMYAYEEVKKAMTTNNKVEQDINSLISIINRI